jgi:heavy metal sensor kinase
VNLRSLLRSIRVRLTLWYVLLLALFLVVFSGGLYLALRVALHRELDETLRNGALLIADGLQLDDQGHLVAASGQVSSTKRREEERIWRVLDASGRAVAQTVAHEMEFQPIERGTLEAALAGRDAFQTVALEEESLRVYTTPVHQQGRVVGVVQVGLSLEDVTETLDTVLWILRLSLPLTLVAASVGGYFLADRALRPVDRITRTVQSITASDLSRRLNFDLPDDELGRLADTLDAMIARLDAAFRRQRSFTADASHELRTPLTVIKGDLSVALGRPRDVDYYHGVLTEVDEEVDQMSRLVDRLLSLARADAEGIAINRETVDLGILLTDVVAQVRPLAGAKGLELTSQIETNLTARVDPDVVTQIVLNLLDNAIKYTPAGRVRLGAHRTVQKSSGPNVHDTHELQIAVSDEGPGISGEHLPHIFERFYRVDRARSRELGGAGLGMSIARELARAHGGDITVRSVLGEGSTFTVHLPLD